MYRLGMREVKRLVFFYEILRPNVPAERKDRPPL